MQIRRLIALAAMGLLSLAGCTVTSSDTGSSEPSSGDAGTTGAESIRFTEDEILYAPGQTVSIDIEVSPPGRYSVRFAIIGDGGNGFLDRNEVRTNARGAATVLLTTPSTPSSFRIRASVDDNVHAEIRAEVLTAMGHLRVAPKYVGQRSQYITEWTATVHIDGDCAALPGVPPRDGTIVASAPAQSSVLLENVPVGPPLAVTLRAGHFAGGCTNVASISADATSDVVVNISDARLRLDGPTMQVSMGVRSTESSSSALNGAIDTLMNAALADSTSDASLLLDDMEDSAAGAAGDFQASRDANGWDAVLKDSGPDLLAANGLRLLMRQWLVEGTARLLTNNSLLGTLSPVSDEEATFSLTEVAGLDPEAAGFTTPTSLTWEADPDDTVRMSAELFLLSSQLLAELAGSAALEAHPDASGVGDALSRELTCAAVSDALLGDATEAYTGCGDDCLTTLCESALRAAWDRARTTLNRPARLAITAAVGADISDEARLTGFVGRWVGVATGWADDATPEFEGSFIGVALE